MRPWAVVGAAAAGATAGVVALGGLLWTTEIARGVSRLRSQRAQGIAFSRADLASLPAPVVRYFNFALTPGQALVSDARFRQVGDFALRVDSWNPFTATEHFRVDPPGFLWNANIRVARMIPILVRDGYCAGEGALVAKVGALFSVADQRGTPEMASAELLRYLAETVLFPTALLPRGGICWTELDDTRARVTLTDRGTTVSCDMSFGGHGEITGMSAMRHRTEGGKLIATRWVGHWADYRRVGGMMIPMSGDVGWVLPEGVFTYWRGRIVDAHHRFATAV